MRYQIQFIDMPDSQSDGDTWVSVMDINTFGQAVGFYHADLDGGRRLFFYDPQISTDQAVDLNMPVGQSDDYDQSIIRGFNRSGQTVGYYYADLDGDGVTEALRAFLYDPQISTDQAVDLNEIVEGIPEGWSIRQATAINVVGDISVYLEPEIKREAENLRAGMIDMSATPPQLHLIDDRYLTAYSVAEGMNDWGDIVVKYHKSDGALGHYVYNFGLYLESLATISPIDLDIDADTARPLINNAGQVVGRHMVDGLSTPYRYSPDGAFESFTELVGVRTGMGPVELNDLGEFTGAVYIQIKKRLPRLERYVMGSELEMFEYGYGWFANRGLNNSGDVASDRSWLHRDWGYLDFQTMFDPSDPDTAYWADNVIGYELDGQSDRDSTTGFPMLTGVAQIQDTGWSMFLLTPVPAP